MTVVTQNKDPCIILAGPTVQPHTGGAGSLDG
jgi:hypothetical protein